MTEQALEPSQRAPVAEPLAEPVATAPGEPGAAPFGRSDLLAAVLIFGFAFVLRLVYLHQAWALPFFEEPIVDALSYDLWGQRLAAGDWLGQETFYQAPAYPYFLGLVYSVFGHDLWMLRIVQIVLGAASCALLFVATRRMFGRPAAIASGLLLACYAPAIFFDGLIQKTTLGLFLTSVLLVLLVGFVGRPRAGTALAAGAVAGLLALTRENALIFALLIPACLAFTLRANPRKFAFALAFAGGLLLVLLPVGVRNGVVGETFTITTSQMGPNFYIGNNAHATGMYQPLVVGRHTPAEEGPDARRLAEWELDRKLSAGEVSDFWLSESLAWIRSEPAAFLRLLFLKALLTVNDYEIPDTEDLYVNTEFSPLLRWLAPITRFGVLLPLGLAGIVFAWRERDRRRGRDPVFLLVAMGVVFAAAVAAFYVWARYRFPLVPLLIPFAGLALARTLSTLWDGALRSLVAPAVALVLGAAVSNVQLVDRNAFLGTAWTNLGIIMLDAGKLPEAEQYLVRSALLHPKGPDIQYQLGVLRFRQERYELARRHLLRADAADVRAERLLTEVLRRQEKAREPRAKGRRRPRQGAKPTP